MSRFACTKPPAKGADPCAADNCEYWESESPIICGVADVHICPGRTAAEPFVSWAFEAWSWSKKSELHHFCPNPSAKTTEAIFHIEMAIAKRDAAAMKSTRERAAQARRDNVAGKGRRNALRRRGQV